MADETRILHCGAQDEALKERLAADAAEQEASINDLAVGILAKRFKVNFAGSGRRSPGFRGSAVGAYRMPLPLWLAISHEAANRQTTKKAVVADVLADHYGLAPVADAA